MDTALVARPTTYRGIQMRSRLEAHVAGFLDEAGFDWTYEPRAYGSGRAQYLPDLEIRFGDGGLLFIEIKGKLKDTEARRAALLRMEIVLASEPDARLVLIEADWFARGKYEFFLRDPLFPSIHGWRPGRFALCRCGSIYITPVKTSNVPVPLDSCGQCSGGDVVAWLNPTARVA